MGASYEWIVNPELNEDQVRMRVKAALTAGAAVVVVTPAMLAVAAPMLEGTGVRLAAACDWPFGMATTAAKVSLIEECCRRWDVAEVVAAPNRMWLRSGMRSAVVGELRAQARAAHAGYARLTLAVQRGMLNDFELDLAAACGRAAGADSVLEVAGMGERDLAA